MFNFSRFVTIVYIAVGIILFAEALALMYVFFKTMTLFVLDNL
nr:MAG TPA: hypothetical protein [Caudoviricetes sp.]